MVTMSQGKVRKALLTTLLSLMVLLLATVGGGAWYVNRLLAGIQDPDALVHITPAPGELDGQEDLVDDDGTVIFEPVEQTLNKELPEHVVNILIMGLDGGWKASRSDAMMVASINKKTGEVKLTSILRDTQVPIEGRAKPDKIAHAHAYGGAALSIKTVNRMFKLNIEDYVSVNFNSMAQIIDALGGVTINVKPSEVAYVNRGVREVNRQNGVTESSGELYSSGKVLLTGKQAVAYGRIRLLDTDMQRVQRQQTVLTALFEKLMKQNLIDLPTMIERLVPYVRTSMTQEEMLTLGTAVLMNNKTGVSGLRLPANEEYNVISKPSDWHIELTEAQWSLAIKRLHEFIYGES